MPAAMYRTKTHRHDFATGKTHTHERPRTLDEQAEIDDDADALLAEAGIAPRSRGRVYCLEVPTGIPDLNHILKLIAGRAW